MYTLFGTIGSGSAAVEAALELAQLPYRVVRASSWERDSAQAELLVANPLGQIPTLRLPDGGVLTESAAILIHLGLEHPASGLLPAQSGARAQEIRGLVYIAANCYSAISIIDYPERWIAVTKVIVWAGGCFYAGEEIRECGEPDRCDLGRSDCRLRAWRRISADCRRDNQRTCDHTCREQPKAANSEGHPFPRP